MGNSRLHAAPAHRKRRRGRAEEPDPVAADESHRRVPRVSVAVAARTEPRGASAGAARDTGDEFKPSGDAGRDATVDRAVTSGAGRDAAEACAGATCDATEEPRTRRDAAKAETGANRAAGAGSNARDRDAFARRTALRRRPRICRTLAERALGERGGRGPGAGRGPREVRIPGLRQEDGRLRPRGLRAAQICARRVASLTTRLC